ncbi:MAG: transglutaminase family protein [Rikenellaceae bacterium]
MKRYRFSYHTSVKYDAMVTAHNFLLRCTPRNGDYQRVVEFNVDLLTSAKVSRAIDTFGNEIIYGSMDSRHNIFVVATNGVVECDLYRVVEASPSSIYLVSTHLTAVNQEMVNVCSTLCCDGGAVEAALSIADMIYSNFRYESGVTNVHSTAMQIFALGAGVCQDFAHLLIALCRHCGVMARYVVGLVVGTGETHAWVEVYSNGEWFGIDPTHNKLIDYGYIKIAHGRDAFDCSVSRGVHRGVTHHTTEVRVVVEEDKI